MIATCVIAAASIGSMIVVLPQVDTYFKSIKIDTSEFNEQITNLTEKINDQQIVIENLKTKIESFTNKSND